MENPIDLYDRIALAIGKVCYWWSALEIMTLNLCHHTAAVKHSELLNPELASSTIYAFAENMDMRDRIATLKALACTALPLQEFEQLEAILNRIDNELRPERNRFVHDVWEIDEGKILRAKLGVRVVRAQAFKPEVKRLNVKEYGSINEVDEFAAQCEKVWRELAEFDAILARLVKEPLSKSQQPDH